MKHMWSVAISILCLIAVATSAALPNGTVERQNSYSVQANDGVTPDNGTTSMGALPQNLQPIQSSTKPASGTLNRSFLLNDDALDGIQTVLPRSNGLQQSCIPPGGRCHRRGSCCPVPPYHDVCGGNGTCTVL